METRRGEERRDVLKSAVRVRILGWLAGQKQPRTKREIGRALSLSNAAAHYHVTQLEKAGLVQLEGTRPGPNSITEKLYAARAVTDHRREVMGPKDQTAFYLRYTVDSISEMHREAEELVKADEQANRLLVGCYGVHATEDEIQELKARLFKMLSGFYQSHRRRHPGTRPMALTFGIVPSSGVAWLDTQKVLDTLG